MTIEQAVYTLLVGEPTVSALVGTRIYPDEAPQDAAFPFVVYSQADRQSTMTYGGPVELDAWSMTIEVEAETKASVRATSQAIRTKMLGFRGTASGLLIRGVFDQSESGSLEIPQHADERGVFSVQMDFTIWYIQA